jgi:hypothetical protein
MGLQYVARACVQNINISKSSSVILMQSLHNVNGPLPHLLYLNVACSEITSIAIHAAKLTNFVYTMDGQCLLTSINLQNWNCRLVFLYSSS